MNPARDSASSPTSAGAPSGMPARLGPYVIEDRLGSGGMGVVYRARHEQTGAIAALKTVHLPLRGAVAGLRAEIHALGRMQHPGIVRILGEGLSEPVPWYAMELLEGRNVSDWIADLWRPAYRLTGSLRSETSALAPTMGADEQGIYDRPTYTAVSIDQSNPSISGSSLAPGTIPPRARGPAAAGKLKEALTLARRLCSPLQFMHGEGIVHRDLKPSNIVLRPDGMPVIVDFGLVSRAEGAVGREVVEILGHVAGTAAYIAPEQIQAIAVDARCDLYALGCILYELITGLPPFEGVGITKHLARHLTEPPRPPSEVCDDVPPGLDALILRLLAKDRRHRIGHAEDVASMLADLGADEPGWALTAAPRPYLFRPQLAGRAEALGGLSTHLERARNGEGGMVFVGGESGVGKSYLATAVARAAVLERMRVVTCECIPVATDMTAGELTAAPLHPFRRLFEAIADECRERGDAMTERILGENGKILAAFDPNLARIPGIDAMPEPSVLPAQAARARVQRAAAAVLGAFAEEQPLLLVIDDVQWADELSLAVLESLAQDFFHHRRVLVLCMFRSEEIREALASLLRSPGVHRIDLGRLDESTIGVLVGEMLAMPAPPSALVVPLADRSAGNPFFVAEYLRAAVAEGLLVREDGRWRVAGAAEATEATYEALPLPRSLRDIIGRRLAGLPPAAGALVEAAAVLGRESDGAVLLALDGDADGTGADALRELVARQVLEEVRGGRYRFVHDKLREFAYARIEDPRRRALHAAAADRLERRHAGTRSFELMYSELAHHFGEAGDTDKAIDYLEAAAEQALRTFNNREAAGFFGDALAADDRTGRRIPAIRRAAWERKLGLVRTCTGQHTESLGALHRAVALLGYPFPASRRELVPALLREVAVQVAHRVRLPEPTPEGDPRRAHLLEAARAFDLLVPVNYFVDPDVPRILYATIKNLNLSERAGPSPELALAYGSTQVAVGLIPWASLAASYGQRMEQVLAGVDDAEVRCWAYVLAGSAWGSAGRMDRTLHYGQRTVELADRLKFGRRREEGLGLQGAAFTARGEYASHRDVSAAIYASALRGDPQTQLWGLVGEAHARVALGDVDEGLRLAEKGALLVPQNNPPERVFALGVLAIAHLRAGRRGEARTTAERCLIEQEAISPTAFFIADALYGVAEVFFTLFDEERPGAIKADLRDLLLRALHQLRRSSRVFRAHAPRTFLYRGKVAAVSGQPRRAAYFYARGQRAAEALHLDVEVALLSTAQAALLAPTDPSRRALLASARAVFTTRGAIFALAQVDALAQVGAPPASRTEPARRAG